MPDRFSLHESRQRCRSGRRCFCTARSMGDSARGREPGGVAKLIWGDPMLRENAPRIRTEVQVMFFDTDCAAVVHNIAYLRFIEVARTLLAAELGLGLATMAETQKYPVVARTEIDYRRAAVLGGTNRTSGGLAPPEAGRGWGARWKARGAGRTPYPDVP